MTLAYFITHPDVVVDPAVPVERWPLSERGRSRMRRILARPWATSLSHVFCSSEQKARDGAEILERSLGLPVTVLPNLGENDRSATGFLPPPEFWAVVEEFFAHPEVSVRGWETAADAQKRVLAAVGQALDRTGSDEEIAFVAHGGVGCLLLCHLKGVPISRSEEQPSPPDGSPAGAGGGNYFAFDRSSLTLHAGWQPIEPRG